MYRFLPGASALERRALAWMCLIIGVNQLGFGAMIPTMPLYAETFGVSLSAIGAAVAAYGLARCLGALPTGKLADLFGRRPTLAIGGIVSALGNLGCALTGDYSVFLLFRFVSGVGAALVLTTGIVVLADISRPERRGRMMSIYQGIFVFSVGIGPLPGGLLAEYISLEAPFVAYAIAGAFVTIIAWIAIPESKEMAETSSTRADQIPFLRQLKILMSRSSMQLVCGLSFVHAFTRTGGIFSVVPILGASLLGLSATQIGLGMALGSVVGLFVIYPSGALADRYGRKAVIVPGTLLTGVAFGLFFFSGGFLWFTIASALWGISSSIGSSAPAAYAADAAPPGMNAAAIGCFRMLADVGYVIGPIAMGMLADFHGPKSAMIGAALLMLTTGAVFGLLAPETRRFTPRSTTRTHADEC